MVKVKIWLFGKKWGKLGQKIKMMSLVSISLNCLQMHIAAANGYTEVVNFLIDNGAKIDVVDNDYWQPIHAAACWGQVKYCFTLPFSVETFRSVDRNLSKIFTK